MEQRIQEKIVVILIYYYYHHKYTYQRKRLLSDVMKAPPVVHRTRQSTLQIAQNTLKQRDGLYLKSAYAYTEKRRILPLSTTAAFLWLRAFTCYDFILPERGSDSVEQNIGYIGHVLLWIA